MNDWTLVDQREGVDAGHVGDGDARRAAAELEQEPAVARRGPAGAERDVRPGLAVDVRDAVRVVDEPQSGPPGRLLVRRLDRREVLGKVEVVDVGRGDVVAQRREPGVERKLVRGVGGGREAAEVAGRQDVARKVRSHCGDCGENTKRQD